MKAFLLTVISFGYLFGSVYYAKVEPVSTYHVKSSVSGKVEFVDTALEGKMGNSKVVIQIDDKLDKIDLKSSKEKLVSFDKNIQLTKQNLQNAKTSLSIEQDNYDRVKNLKTKSKFEKDAKLMSLINTKNGVLKIEQSLESLKSQKIDLNYKISALKDKIDKKNIKIKNNLYIYKIYPDVGEYVNPGINLIDAMDTSKGKLTIYLTNEDLKEIDKKVIYLNDKASTYKVSKIWQVADSQNISAYKTEIIIEKPALFSKLIKIEFKSK